MIRPHLPRRPWLPSLVLCLGLAQLGCSSPSGIVPLGMAAESLPIELERFMGEWYVIAHIPTSVEAQAHDAVERYTLQGDGTIDVRFEFCDGAPDGPLEIVTMTGWVHDPATGAEWRVRPVWPLALSYQIRELDPDHATTVVGHPSGSYAWLMARTPSLPEETIAAVTARLADAGYEVERMRRVPHAGGACKEGGTGA